MNHSGLYLLIGVLIALPVVFVVRSGIRRKRAAVQERNPGPDWGYAFIAWSLRRMPPWFNRTGTRLGAWFAFWLMPGQRACSREYLRLALGREPRMRDVCCHFRAFTEYLILRLSICHGREPDVCFAPGDGDELRALAGAGRQALYGTLHLGHSDLIGFFLGSLGGRLHMIRKQVGNSDDTDRLARRYAGCVSFIWINDWSRLVLAMNDALCAGRSLALQCDRPEYSSKRAGFDFFGQTRAFPFTIYHLAIMHGLPVVLSYAVPAEDEPGCTVVHTPPIFHPEPGHENREKNFAAAHRHFQAFLAAIETRLRRTPYLWFNFTPMNPIWSAEDAATRRRAAGAVSSTPVAKAPGLVPGDMPTAV